MQLLTDENGSRCLPRQVLTLNLSPNKRGVWRLPTLQSLFNLLDVCKLLFQPRDPLLTVQLERAPGCVAPSTSRSVGGEMKLADCGKGSDPNRPDWWSRQLLPQLPETKGVI